MRVATIGVFDGVHRGHQALIARARAWAQEPAAALAEPGGNGDGAHVVAVTFDPNPIAVLRPELAPPMLTTIGRREQLLRVAGADDVVVVEFTREFSEQSPEDFARFLASPDGVGAEAVVAGDNFRFGRGAAGDIELLAALGREWGFAVEAFPLVTEEVPGEGLVRWSSTYVRAQIAEGEVARAAHVLGRPHRLEGVVVAGDRRGRDLGYPTANTDVVPGMAVPADGVYAGWLVDQTEGVTHPVAISVGTNPQFDGVQRRVEAHVVGADGWLDLYDHVVGIDFVDRLRGQEVFASVDDLVVQMGRDTERAREILGA